MDPAARLPNCRRNIKVMAANGVTHNAAGWVSPSGRPHALRRAMVTADRDPVGTVVCVRDPEIKQATIDHVIVP